MSTRQEIYERIRQTSKDEYILEEMIRLGFWPRGDGMPTQAEEDIRRQGELQREVRQLTYENAQLQNVEALRKAARKKRLAESRQKRKENKERRLREREEKAKAWQEQKQRDIVYLGDEVSAGLGHQQSDGQRLQRRNMPLAHNAEELAAAMGISVGELRFLAFFRRVSETTHYRRFSIPKKSGGTRTISAPMPRLKQAQEWCS